MYIDRPHSPAGDFDFGVALWSLAVPLDEVSEWTTSTPVNRTSARLGWLRTDAEHLARCAEDAPAAGSAPVCDFED